MEVQVWNALAVVQNATADDRTTQERPGNARPATVMPSPDAEVSPFA